MDGYMVKVMNGEQKITEYLAKSETKPNAVINAMTKFKNDFPHQNFTHVNAVRVKLSYEEIE